MSVTFRQLITPWSATTPAVSGSFTPNAAADTLLAVCMDATNSGETMSMTGSSTYTFPQFTVCGLDSNANFRLGQQVPNNFQDPFGQTGAAGYCLSCASGAQTASAISSGTGDKAMGLILDYSGVGFVNTGWGSVNTPSSLVGQTLGVPTGSVLVSICLCISSSAALTNSNGTSRGSGTWNGQAYSISEFTGAGSTVTPGWTQTGAPYTSNYYDFYYFLMTPSGGIAPIYVVQSVTANETAGPWTATFGTNVAIGDLIIAVLAGGGTTPFPVTVTDSVNSGAYTLAYEYFDSTYNMYGAIYYKVANTLGSPVVTATSGNYSTGFLGLVQVSGFGSNTPTVDATASVHSDGSGTTQGGSVSSGQPNEILLCAPWNVESISSQPAGWFPMGIGDDNTFWSVLLTPQANNFAGTLGSSSNWVSVFTGIYSSAAGATPEGPVNSNGHPLISNGHPVISGAILPLVPLAWIIERRRRLMKT